MLHSAMGYSHYGFLPEDNEALDLRSRVRKWEKSVDGVTLISLSKEQFDKKGGSYLYASCGLHDKCKAKFKFLQQSGHIFFQPHSGESDHASGPRVARASSSHPVPRASIQKVKALAEESHRSKRPLEINMQLEDPLPGQVVQRAVSKHSKSLRSSERSLEIKELRDFLESHYCNLETNNIPNTGLVTLHFDVRNCYLAMGWTFGDLIKTLSDALVQQPQQWGLVAQADYSGQVSWSNSRICVIGVQLYHRDSDASSRQEDRRWRKVLIPISFVMNPFEDSDHYRLGFSWAKSVIVNVCCSKGLDVPSPIFHTVHGDWTRALQRECTEPLGSQGWSKSLACHTQVEVFLADGLRDPLRFCDHVICDLEHLYRHIKSRDDLSMSTVFFSAFWTRM